ncbi:SOUL heme-binding protein [Desulfuromonas soudanensis]|uniref:SOUL heme-binding protein n=1 Tax=Desulfuromonas soudanensis TaxID=1603606 RepID=A0A0M4CZP1_9BACT|nr:heme-binding protein [Desulfuromonas soudanensis]ALC15546.1 SOUL heme-binding protein [Desulfuromonas soudanensis]
MTISTAENRFRLIATVALFIFAGVVHAMATEEAPYTVLKTDHIFELREYPPQILAEIIVEGELEDAGSKAFRPLFRYISGDNRSRGKIAMTAPVSQEQLGEKISMTAPVSQQRVQGKWAVSFMMPPSYTLETLPVPDDPDIKLRQVPARQVATVRYSGFWSEKKYQLYKEKLEKWIKDNRFTVTGEPVWARYNPPFTPWFMRRNEIQIPVDAGAD